METKKVLRALMITCVVFGLLSCGGKKKEEVPESQSVELKPYETKVKGYLSDALEVVEGTYKFEITKDGGIIPKAKIQIQIKSVGITKDYGFVDGNNGPLYLTICDINGRPLSDFSDIPSSFKGDQLLKEMVSKAGEENWILFDEYSYDKQFPTDAATFIITSKKKEKQKESSSSSLIDDNDDDNLTSSSKGSVKFDKMLDDYEKYVDEYIKFYKKAMKGDQSALIQYPKLMEKLTKLSDSMDKVKEDEMSAKQVSRYLEITMKLSETDE
ncbi:MAG: hypothetical protein LBO74_00280 [Candidatus Symbiothrix sp.]|jgi:hypothetical protein|nr:hypothetical protein [Candidatus Symbiothrix sp.]